MSSSSASDPVPPGMESAATLRSMVKRDIAFVTEEHRERFPDNVMGRLGCPFLRRYYATFLDTPYAVATIAENDGRPCGYLVGVLDTRAHRQSLLRQHGAALLASAMLGSVLHPRTAARLAGRRINSRISRSRLRGPTTAAAPTPAKVAVLSHIATVEVMRGQGVGTALVTDFVETAQARGVDRISLATLDGPAGAGQFYDHQGWQLQSRRQTFDGRWIRLYDLELNNDA